MTFHILSLKGTLCLALIILAVCSAFGSEKASLQNPGKQDQSDWYRMVMNSIRDMEYEASWQKTTSLSDGKPGYHMVNRAQNLRLYFYPEGVKAIRRTEPSPSWILEWSINGIGRDMLNAPFKPALQTEKNKIEYNRGDVIESYENTKSGIRQRIFINKRPEGSGPLTLALEFDGDPTPVRKDNTRFEFHHKGKGLIQLDKIRAKDAEGMDLSLQTSLEDSRLVITIEDKEAIYPVQLEALLSSLPPWTAESDIAKAGFGDSVSTAGDVNGDGFSDLIIGAPSYDNGEKNEGRVYLYLGSESGPESTSYWQYEGNDVDARVGDSVATAGDVNGDGFSEVIVGAPGFDRGETDEGCALVFFGSGSSLDSQLVILESNQSGSNFGFSVSTAGDVNGDGFSDVIVGADKYKNTLTEEGAVFLYLGNATGLNTSHSWSKYGGQEYAWMGYSVGFAGDVNRDGYSDAIIGAPYYNIGDKDEGMAYVYLGSSLGLRATPVWSDGGDTTRDYLGISVCTAGDVNGDGYADVIVGASGYDNGEISEGSARIYYSSASGLSASPDVILEPNWVSSYFGSSVSTAGDTNGDGYADVIVGAYFSTHDESMEGSAYLYLGSKTGLESLPDWSAESNQVGANYGQSVSTAGDVNGDGYSDIIVGSPNYDGGEDNEGKCFVYYGEPKPPSTGAEWEMMGTQADSDFAAVVASAGDVNGDGCADILVGAPFWDNGQINEGQVRIYHGKPNESPETNPDKIIELNQANAHFGYSLAPAGDIDSDGYDDIIIGAPSYDGNKGRVRVCYGSDNGIDLGKIWDFQHSSVNSRYGESVACAGDVNGDGYADIIVSAPNYPEGSAKGSVFVYHGSSAGLPYSQQWYNECDQEDAFFGNCVASAGDVNGDGYSDIIIGAYGYSNGEKAEGRAYVFYGSYYGVLSDDPWIGEIDQAAAIYGRSVGSAGDVNGDGYSDIIVGAPYYDNEESNEGAAFVYSGGPAGLSGTAPSWKGEGNQEECYYGHSVAPAGDVNGDGFSDVIVGAYSYDFKVTKPFPYIFKDAGTAYIYLGSNAGLSSSSDWTAVSRVSKAQLGRCVASAGDVNADGFCDVIIGSPGHEHAAKRMGRAALYLGGGGNGYYRDPNQFNPTPRRKISRLGRSSIDSTGLGIVIFSPWGRGKVKSEWDYKPFGTPLDGTDTRVLDWRDLKIDLDRSDITLDEPQNTLFHWRARLRYDPVTLPWQPHGPWVSIPWNGMQEADFRMGPSEETKLSDVIDHLLGRNHYPYDTNSDCKVDAADAIYLLIK